MGIYFNGKYIVKPGAYSSIDADSMTSITKGSPNIVALVGTSKGGIPGEIMWFDDPTVAQRVLKGGYLMKACQKCWSPTKQGGGAQLIGVIRADKATQSVLSLGDGIAKPMSIGEVITGLGNTSTGSLTVSGNYTGKEDISIEIYIDSTDTVDETALTYRWRIIKNNITEDNPTWEVTNQSNAQNGAEVELFEGIKIAFSSGNYVCGDTFIFSLSSAKDERTALKVISKDYGDWTKKIQIKQETGSIINTKRVCIYYWEDNIYETFDNLGVMAYFEYRGEYEYAVLEVLPDKEGNAERLITKIGESEDNCIIDLDIYLKDDRFRQIKQLVDYINSYENYKCEFYSEANQALGSTDLDIMTATLEKEKPVIISAYWADITKTISAKSQYINIERVDKLAKIPSDFEYTNLDGGTDGDVPTSWVEYFDKFGSHPITYLVPITGDNAIHAEARAHVDYMSNTMGRERFLICGGYAGETADDAKKRAASHNSDRVQLAFPGFYDFDKNNELTLYPSFVTAAMYAGRAAFLERGESATFDYYAVEALEYELEPMTINELLNSGVAPLEFVIGSGNRLVQDITTYTQNAISLYTERSVRILADAMNKDLREKIEQMIIGQKGSRTPLTSVKNLVISFLKQKMREEEIIGYRNVRVIYSDGVLNIEYEVAPVEPVNFALIKGHFYTEEIVL